MTPIYQKAKDIFTERKTSKGTFEEYPVIVQPNSVVTINSANDMIMMPLTAFAQGSSSLSSSVSQTASLALSESFDGTRSIKRGPYTGIVAGGTTVGDFLNNFFFPFIPATLSINSGMTYYETGSLQTYTVLGTTTVNDETIFGSGSLFRDGVSYSLFTSPSYSVLEPIINVNHVYEAFEQVGNNGSPIIINSATKTVSFIFPFLYGVSATPGLTGTALYFTLSGKDISPQNNKSYNIGPSTAVYLYFAYPASMPNLTSALDPNLFQVLSSYNLNLATVTSVGLSSNWSAIYKIYQWQTIANFNGVYQWKF